MGANTLIIKPGRVGKHKSINLIMPVTVCWPHSFDFKQLERWATRL